jgi:predicted transcriptional regulator
LLTHFCSKLIWVKRDVVRAKRVFCQLAVKEIGYSGAEVARFLGVTTSAVNRSANSEEIPEVNRDL